MHINTLCPKEHFLCSVFTCCLQVGSSQLLNMLLLVKWYTEKLRIIPNTWLGPPPHFPALVRSRMTLQTGLCKCACNSPYSGTQLVGYLNSIPSCALTKICHKSYPMIFAWQVLSPFYWKSEIFTIYKTSLDVHILYLTGFNCYLFTSMLFHFWKNNFNMTIVFNFCKGEAFSWFNLLLYVYCTSTCWWPITGRNMLWK